LGRTWKPGRAGSSEAVSCTRRPALAVALSKVVSWHARAETLCMRLARRIRKESHNSLCEFWFLATSFGYKVIRKSQIGTGKLVFRASDNNRPDEHLFSLRFPYNGLHEGFVRHVKLMSSPNLIDFSEIVSRPNGNHEFP